MMAGREECSGIYKICWLLKVGFLNSMGFIWVF